MVEHCRAAQLPGEGFHLALKHDLVILRLPGPFADARSEPLTGVFDVHEESAAPFRGADSIGERIVGQHQFHDFPRRRDLVHVARRSNEI